MLRITGVLALLASLALGAFLANRIHRHAFSGSVDRFDDRRCSFWADYSCDGDFWLVHFRPPLPDTFPEHLADLRSEGTKGDSVLVCTLQLPEELRGHALAGQAAEVRHESLELPIFGAVAGTSLIRLGQDEWRENPWRFRGVITGIALLPLLAWSLVSIPVLLLPKRPRPA